MPAAHLALPPRLELAVVRPQRPPARVPVKPVGEGGNFDAAGLLARLAEVG